MAKMRDNSILNFMINNWAVENWLSLPDYSPEIHCSAQTNVVIPFTQIHTLKRKNELKVMNAQ